MFKFSVELTSKAGLVFFCFFSVLGQIKICMPGAYVYNNKNHKPVYNFESDGIEIADLLHFEVGKLCSNIT